MLRGPVIVSSCCLTAAFAGSVRWMTYVPKQAVLPEALRTSFLRSHDSFTVMRAPVRPLLVMEQWQVLSGRALWIMLLILCPLIGYSFSQAVALYGQSSLAAEQSPMLARSLSPLDGLLVPTFGAYYVTVTLLFPFVAIRALSPEKETGSIRLLVQLPYRRSTLVGA